MKKTLMFTTLLGISALSFSSAENLYLKIIQNDSGESCVVSSQINDKGICLPDLTGSDESYVDYAEDPEPSLVEEYGTGILDEFAQGYDGLTGINQNLNQVQSDLEDYQDQSLISGFNSKSDDEKLSIINQLFQEIESGKADGKDVNYLIIQLESIHNTNEYLFNNELKKRYESVL